MDDYGDARFGYSNWLDGGPVHTSQPSAKGLAADYLPVDTDGPDLAGPDEQCPACGERRADWLDNDDGMVTCQSCGTVYDLDPERPEATNV